MGAWLSQFVSEYLVWLSEDPLEAGAPLLFCACVATLLVIVVSRVVNDRNWAPQRFRRRDAISGNRFPKYKEDANGNRRVHYPGWMNGSARQLTRRAGSYYTLMKQRRSVRQFSDRPVPRAVIESCIKTAGTAPSGAHQQPWRFVVIQDPEMKHKLRLAAEAEEELNYKGRMNDQWLDALAPIGTDANKSYYDKVPYVIVIFKITHSVNPETGEKQPHYYFERSVGIAAGMLIAAIHNAGLCTLTHTPTPMGFLTKMLDRPSNEKPYLMLPVGYAADDCYVPDLHRKALEDIMIWH